MDQADLTDLRQFVGHGSRARTLYFHADVAADDGALARGLSTLVPAPVHLLRLDGEYLTPEEGSDVTAALLGGDTILLIVRGQHPLATRFLSVWFDANRPNLGHYFAVVGRHLTISLDSSHTRRGMLVVLQVTGERLGSPWRHFLGPGEVTELEALGIATMDRVVRGIGVASRAQEAAGLTYKDLCLLHLRDGPEIRRRSPSVVLDGRENPVAWIDLREIIRTRGPNVERQLKQLRHAGLLDEDGWNFYQIANDFLETQAAGPTQSSIYEAIWRYQFLESDEYFFRGQIHNAWKLETSLFREPSADQALDVATLVERAQRTSLFLTLLRRHHGDFFRTEPSDEELLAVAQHYGFATPLLDFSRSLRVAAFFATDGADKLSPTGGGLGVIHYLKPNDRRSSQLLNRQTPIGLEGFDLFRDAGLHFGQWQVLEPALAEADNRIARQHGAFIQGGNVRHLSDMKLGRIVFAHRPGDVFEDAPAGVTRAELLPDQSHLAALAADVKQRFDAGERAPIHPALRGVHLPTPSIIGAQHAWLDIQVEEAADFFVLLREVADAAGDQSLLKRLVAGIQDYFVDVRMLADLGAPPTEPSPGQSRSSPLERAVARMCEESGAPCDGLWKTVAELVPDWDDGTWRAPELPGDRRLDTWLVLACAVYLIGWEHLTSVQGARSRAFSTKAREILHMVKDQLKPAP